MTEVTIESINIKLIRMMGSVPRVNETLVISYSEYRVINVKWIIDSNHAARAHITVKEI